MKFNVSLKGILKMSLVSRSGTSIAAAAATLILTGLALAPACTRRKAKGVVSVLMPARAKGLADLPAIIAWDRTHARAKASSR